MRAACKGVRYEEAVAFRSGVEIAFAQEQAVVRSDQQRPVGPAAHEGFIEAARFNQHMNQAERERRVGAGTYPKPTISLLRERGCAWIDHHQARAVHPAATYCIRLCEPRGGRVMAPQDAEVGVLPVRRRHAASERECMSKVLVTVADLRRVTNVRTPKVTHETLDPVDAVRQRRAAWRGHAEHHGLRTAFAANGAQPLADFRERFVP